MNLGIYSPLPVASTSKEQREVHRRVAKEYLPAWCAANRRRVDSSSFRPDWSFLTAGLAEWFLAALDAHVVTIQDGWPRLPASPRRAHLFQGDRGIATLNREGFVEVAAAGTLSIRYEWPPESMRFQSDQRGVGGLAESRHSAFDLLAYKDDNRHKVAIAVEAKWRPGDVRRLASALEACGERRSHSEDACNQSKVDHRKYVGLREHQPRILWIVGPESFAGTTGLVFRVRVKADGMVRLTDAESDQLAASAFG